MKPLLLSSSNTFITPRENSITVEQLLPITHLILQLFETISFPSQWIYLSGYFIKMKSYNKTLCVWLLLLSIVIWRFISAVLGSQCFIFMAKWYSTISIEQILFISVLWEGMGCFYLLIISDSAAINICVQVFKDLFLNRLGICLEVELLGHMVILCFTFWAISTLFPWWLNHFTSLPAVHEDSNFSTSLPTVDTFCFCFK